MMEFKKFPKPGRRERIHVVPRGDEREHDTNSLDGCWCGPIHDEEFDIVTHRAADKRALYEDTLFTKVFQ